MQGTFLLMATSVQRSVGLWSQVGLCTLWIKILQVALRRFSQWSHIAFTLICFIFICFFSSFFCSRRKAASCRQGHRDLNEHRWALQRASWSFQKSQKRPAVLGFTSLTTWAGSSLGAFACFRKQMHVHWKLSAYQQISNQSWPLLAYLQAAREIS